MHHDYLDTAPQKLNPIVNLIQWATNEDLSRGTSYLAFIDLIGHSREHFGDTLNAPTYQPGYLEADYLADALKCWANYPQDVEEFILNFELNAID
jgi:hypothetical protein